VGKYDGPWFWAFARQIVLPTWRRPKSDQDHHISTSPTVPHILAALGVFTKRIIPGVSAFEANTCGTQPL